MSCEAPSFTGKEEMQENPKRLNDPSVSMKEISEDLNIPITSVYYYRKIGLFPAYKIGKHYRVKLSDYEQFKKNALSEVLALMEMGR